MANFRKFFLKNIENNKLGREAIYFGDLWKILDYYFYLKAGRDLFFRTPSPNFIS